jgi:uncharacterized membrane protein
MKIFSKFGDIILTLFSYMGSIVIGIIRLPSTLRKMDIKRTGPEKIKETVQKIDTEQISDKISDITSKVDQKSSRKDNSQDLEEEPSIDDGPIIIKNINFDSKEKEDNVLKLQIASGVFLIASVLFVFRFVSLLIYGIVGAMLVGFIVYTLYYKIKVMYPQDFNAYRDFFFLYVAVGLIMVLVGGNTSLTMAFPFQIFPSFTLLIFAVLAVGAVFLIFRMKYHRNYTFGEIIEAGNNTSHVKVDYDIRSNVKPDIYIVENNGFDVVEQEMVKIEIDGSAFNMKGNRPSKVIGKVEGFN